MNNMTLALSINLDIAIRYFLGDRFTIWRGTADGNGLVGKEVRDTREDALTKIDWERVSFTTNLEDDEMSIHGEEKLFRVECTDNIQLNLGAAWSLWCDWLEKRQDSVLEKLRKTRGIENIGLLGVVLRNPCGERYVLILFFRTYKWNWGCGWLNDYWTAMCPSASIEV